ncbi:hypothetical protein VNO80_22095 [Phaseolus coccineus]|uniref:Uncharacterized protein n=1 Tax=Phaseolus coccineus TaxID=3886 RepID=A0AAN9M519_PHACN
MESSKIYAYLFLSILFISSATPILGCGYCGKPPKKQNHGKKPKTPVVKPPVTLPPISVPPIVKPPVTVPPITVPPVTVPPIALPPTGFSLPSSTHQPLQPLRGREGTLHAHHPALLHRLHAPLTLSNWVPVWICLGGWFTLVSETQLPTSAVQCFKDSLSLKLQSAFAPLLSSSFSTSTFMSLLPFSSLWLVASPLLLVTPAPSKPVKGLRNIWSKST